MHENYDEKDEVSGLREKCPVIDVITEDFFKTHAKMKNLTLQILRSGRLA